jgi:peptidoglycan hydrolase-like protein with peptidoglycan-binding domain
MSSSDVRRLQQYLNAQGFQLAAVGAGSPSSESDYFGTRTYDALVKFQEAHASEILAPAGLVKGSGIFGTFSRAFVNKMLSSI